MPRSTWWSHIGAEMFDAAHHLGHAARAVRAMLFGTRISPNVVRYGGTYYRVSRTPRERKV